MTFACRPNYATGFVDLSGLTSFGDIEIDPADATATLSLGTNGDLDMVGTVSQDSQWFNPETTGIGSSYWCRLTVTSGTSPTGSATGSWLALSSARSWSLTRTSTGITEGNYTLAIASDAAGANIVASKAFTMQAAVDV